MFASEEHSSSNAGSHARRSNASRPRSKAPPLSVSGISPFFHAPLTSREDTIGGLATKQPTEQTDSTSSTSRRRSPCHPLNAKSLQHDKPRPGTLAGAGLPPASPSSAERPGRQG